MATRLLIGILSVLLLLVSSGSVLARIEFSREGSSSPWKGSRTLGSESQCQIEKLKAQEPQRRVESEAGHSDYFDATSEEFDCAGVSAVRRTIQPNGLLLPQFSNAPSLVYVIKGRGITGTVVPGCPESFQSFQQQSKPEQEEQRRGDSHQKVHRIREGDVIAFPAGVAHWCHNDGNSELVTIQIMDTSNTANDAAAPRHIEEKKKKTHLQPLFFPLLSLGRSPANDLRRLTSSISERLTPKSYNDPTPNPHQTTYHQRPNSPSPPYVVHSQRSNSALLTHYLPNDSTPSPLNRLKTNELKPEPLTLKPALLLGRSTTYALLNNFNDLIQIHLNPKPTTT